MRLWNKINTFTRNNSTTFNDYPSLASNKISLLCIEVKNRILILSYLNIIIIKLNLTTKFTYVLILKKKDSICVLIYVK